MDFIFVFWSRQRFVTQNYNDFLKVFWNLLKSGGISFFSTYHLYLHLPVETCNERKVVAEAIEITWTEIVAARFYAAVFLVFFQ